MIQRTEELRGLTATIRSRSRRSAPPALRRVVVRELARERAAAQRRRLGRRAAPARACCRPGQSLAQVQQQALSGQVAGLYVPRRRRLYVLGAGGAAPRSVIAHEVVHALQDEHFQLTRGAFAPRPRDHDGELAAQALVEGDATEVQSRYVADALGAATSSSELARTLARRSRGRVRRRCPPYLAAAAALSPTRRARRSCAPCARAAGSACSTAPSATRRARARPCSTRPATWPATRPRGASRCPPGATASRPRSGPRTWPR